jgi:hypothetical protein
MRVLSKVLPQLVQVACDPTHPCRPEILAEIDTMVIFIEPRELNLLFSLTTDTDEEVKTGAAYAIAKWCVWQPPSVSEGIATTNQAVQEALKEFPALTGPLDTN